MAKEGQGKRDIKNLLVVLSSAILCAVLLAVAFIYYYGPSGRYLAGHTILDPSVINEINFQVNDTRTGKKNRFIFDHIEFSYFDSENGKTQKQVVSLENYQKFYRLVAGNLSLTGNTDQIGRLFLKLHPTLLTINIRTLGEKGGTKVFQVIQFIEEDYFRVQLHDKQEQGDWVYFYQPHLYQQVMQLFKAP